MEVLLKDYHDQELIKYLRFGWPVGCLDPGTQTIPKNHKGAEQNKEEIVAYLHKQSQAGTLIGPFAVNPFGERARFSALNTRDKKESGQKRVIVDLSAPKGNSINGGTPKDFFLDQEQELHFPTVDSLVQIIREKGVGCKLFKIDRKSAYKFESIDPGDIHLMGMVFEGQFYFDTTLVMGARHAAGCCHRTSEAFIFILEDNGYRGTCFIDDMAGGDIGDRADRAFAFLRQLLRELNVLEAMDKACPPSTIMVFLGILFDTIRMTMEVTPDRLRDIKVELIRWMNKEVATLRQVQSLVGKLNFCASVVRAGRLFFSRILSFMKTLSDRGYRPITAEVRADLKWWIKFMEDFNGVTAIPEVFWSKPDLVFSTDACLKCAGGWSPAATSGRVDNQFFSVRFPEWIKSDPLVSINELEALSLLVGIKIWGSYCVGKKILVFCDNQATVHIVNSGRAANAFAQSVMRELHFWAAKFQCQVRAVFIGTQENRMADLASRRLFDSASEWEFKILTQYLMITEISVEPQAFAFTNDW